jgi:hypothetical protein
MKRTGLILAGAVALGVAGSSGAANAFDLGYGPRYNNHLSQYDGRPLGPPLTAFGPSQALDDGDPRAFYTPRYQYYNGRLIVTAPGGYVPYRKPRRVYR